MRGAVGNLEQSGVLMMRHWGLSLVALTVVAAPAGAQTVRWNDVVSGLESVEDQPPAVRVWLDQSILRFGAPVRVGFRVEEDAFVVVARVDTDGRLTVLFPAGRTRAAAVRATEDYYVRSARYGSAAAFLATERPGASGYVFALSSRSPMDLSRLRQADFSRWVTGVSAGQPVSRYFGDPYRVIQRFARVVTYSERTEFDYDIAFYSVDLPSYVTASSYSSCAYAGWTGPIGQYGYDNSWWRRGGWLYDEFGLQTGYSSLFDCGRLSDCLIPTFSYGWGGPWFVSSPLCGRPLQVARTGPSPVAPPLTPLDSTINPWVADSISRPNVEKAPGGDGAENGPHVMRERPAPVSGWSDREDLSFSIPSRALRAMRGANRASDGRTPIGAPGAVSGGPIPMPSRPTPEMGQQPQIEWVRPPRSFDAPPRDPVDRLPTRSGRAAAFSRDSDMPTRPGRMDFGGPPPRLNSPMFDREPGRNSTFQPFNGGRVDRGMGGGGGGMYSPPPMDARPMTPGGLMVNPSARGGASSSPPPPAATPPSPPASAGEKKPSEKHH